MNKKIVYKILLCLLFPVFLVSTAIPTGFASAGEGEIIRVILTLNSNEAFINGQPTVLNVAPYSVQGTTLVPLRFVTEALGCIVEWYPEDQWIVLKDGSKVINLYIGKETAVIDDMELKMPLAPVIINGTTMVPIRFVSENFGASVDYNPETSEITIIKVKPVYEEDHEYVTTYTYDDLGYKITYPEDWVKMGELLNGAFLIYGDEETGVNSSVIVLDRIEGLGFEEWVESEIENLKTTFSDGFLKILAQEQLEPVDESVPPAYLINYSLKQGDTKVKVYTLLIYGKNAMYTITVTIPGNLLDEDPEYYEDLVFDIFNSFEELEPDNTKETQPEENQTGEEESVIS